MDTKLISVVDWYLGVARYRMLETSRARVSKNAMGQLMVNMACIVDWNNGSEDDDDVKCNVFVIDNGLNGYYAHVTVNGVHTTFNQNSRQTIRAFAGYVLAKTLSQRTDDSVITEVPRGSMALSQYNEFLWTAVMDALPKEDWLLHKVKRCIMHVTQYQFADTESSEQLFITAHIFMPGTTETMKFIGTAHNNENFESGMVTMQLYDAHGEELVDSAKSVDWHTVWNCGTLDENLFGNMGKLAAAHLSVVLKP